MVKRGFVVMESCACKELTHNVKANAVHFAIVFSFIVGYYSFKIDCKTLGFVLAVQSPKIGVFECLVSNK